MTINGARNTLSNVTVLVGDNFAPPANAEYSHFEVRNLPSNTLVCSPLNKHSSYGLKKIGNGFCSSFDCSC